MDRLYVCLYLKPSQNDGPAPTAAAHIISLIAVPFKLIHQQILLIDSYPPSEPLLTTPPLDLPPMYQTIPSTSLVHNHCPPSVETSTFTPALNPIVYSAMSAKSAQDNTQSVLAPPYLWGSLLTTLDKWGPCTPLRPLILECELSNHPDKAFVKLLLSDISQGCNIRYTGPHFTSIAKNLQSSTILPSILDDSLHSECMHSCILGPFSSPPYPTSVVQAWGWYPNTTGDGGPSTTFLHH